MTASFHFILKFTSFPSRLNFLAANLLLLSFLWQFDLANAGSNINGVASVELADANSASTINPRKLTPKRYCSSSTACSGYEEFCDLETNSCRKSCGYHEYWDGYYCSYCGYGGNWDYEHLRCDYDNDNWIIWTILGVCFAISVGVCIGVAICCVRCASCPFYRRRLQKQAVAPVAVVGQPTMVYGNPPMYSANNHVVYSVPIPGQTQFIPHVHQYPPQQASTELIHSTAGSVPESAKNNYPAK